LQILYPYYEQAAQTLGRMEVFVRSREKERLAALGEMSAGLAHEIRNPLGAIKGAAQFLDPSGDRPDSRFLRVIIEETDRLNRVVTQFLDYSKPFSAEFVSTDVVRLVERSLDYLKPSLSTEVSLKFSPSVRPAWVQAAPEQLQQVIVNLVLNSLKAIEARPEGLTGGLIQVEIEVSGPRGGGEVMISVEDNGIGIPRENLDKLFIPFFTTRPSGTGLGLSISQRIVEAHRGRIEVSSEEGRFSRFSVILPYKEPLQGA